MSPPWRFFLFRSEVLPRRVPSPPLQCQMMWERFGAVGDEESLLFHVELIAGAVSFILRDSDLKKVDALSVEEALALSL